VWIPEGHTYEFLLRNMIKPVGEGSVCAAEAFLVVLYCFLVIIIVVRSSRSSNVHKI
jgi:hypothetical protein